MIKMEKVITYEEIVLIIWKEYYEEMVNETNEREGEKGRGRVGNGERVNLDRSTKEEVGET